jgi:uncharacterized lipoprotein YmbA
MPMGGGGGSASGGLRDMRRPHRPPVPWTAILALAGLSLLAACGGGAPAQLYLLTPIRVDGAVHDPDGIAIGVGPVVIPQYLDRLAIVVRASSNRLEFGDAAEWGGRLDDDITRVLAENLSDLLGTARVAIYPWNSGASVGLQVSVEIVRFEREGKGAVTLGAFWTITDTAGGTARATRHSTITKAIDPSAKQVASYEATVDLMSDALASLSQEIAAALEPMPQ